ncbi:hypothetical protein [Pararobbsia alpina]|uniref:hypothetical protein n=1 Tax=Pararobbsia alpina TaxID=621374 RepID=UPI0015820246|nr:hypothetical protein [Pararobbsia alpina]
MNIFSPMTVMPLKDLKTSARDWARWSLLTESLFLDCDMTAPPAPVVTVPACESHPLIIPTRTTALAIMNMYPMTDKGFTRFRP